MKKGLVLAGGGSRGSYILGVWQAFKEMKTEFDIVTGSSIGALSALMYVQNEFENCEKLWSTVDIKKVVGNGIDFEELNVKGVLLNEQFSGFVKQVVKDKGTDITPFKEMVKEYLNPTKVRESKIQFGVIVTQFPKFIKEEIKVNDLSDEDMFNYIIATASCFPAFPICKFNDKQYIDGGYTDNLPIEYAFKLGAQEVVAIDLNHNVTHKEFSNNPLVNYIYPKWDLGSMLYFEKNTLNKNRILGYYDGLKHFKKCDGIKYTFKIEKRTSYNKLIKELSINITNDTIYSNSKRKLALMKKDFNNIYSYLNNHLEDKATNYDYFIKCVETLAVFFEYDPCKIYSIETMLKEIITTFNDNNMEIEEQLKLLKNNIKRREFIEKSNKKEILSYIYNNSIDYEIKILLLQNNIELYYFL